MEILRFYANEYNEPIKNKIEKNKLYKICQKDKTRMKINEPNHTVTKYINQQLTEIWELHKSNI